MRFLVNSIQSACRSDSRSTGDTRGDVVMSHDMSRGAIFGRFRSCSGEVMQSGRYLVCHHASLFQGLDSIAYLSFLDQFHACCNASPFRECALLVAQTWRSWKDKHRGDRGADLASKLRAGHNGITIGP